MKALFFLLDDDKFEAMTKLFSMQYMFRPQLKIKSPHPLSVFLIPHSLASTLLKTNEKGIKEALSSYEKNKKPSHKLGGRVSAKVESEKSIINTENVLGFIEGTDKKDEIVIITAHYDHLGTKGNKVYNGADDNASGTVAIMHMARAFAEARDAGYPPRRSILFIALTGEELGLFGSEYYSDHSPIFPIENTVCNLNIDMIGREDPSGKFTDDNHLCIVGSDWLSSDLHQVHEEANEKYTKMELDYTYNAKDHPEMFYYRSDQYNFAKKGIPVIFYTSGDHKDYHKTSDTSDKILFNRMEKITRLIFHTTWEIANREERLRVDKK